MTTLEDRLVENDVEAMRRHADLNGSANTGTLTTMSWGILRGLGVTDGRMLAVGTDVATLRGIPAIGRFQNHGSSEYTAAIPRNPDVWPHNGATPIPFIPGMPRLHDVVLANLPYADLHLSSVHGSSTRNRVHGALVQNAVDHLPPGGLAIIVTNHRYLDAPGKTRREMIRREADLLGMARLAGRTLHPDLPDETTSPVDLLVLRKRLPGEPDRSRPFIASERVHYGPPDGGINTFCTSYLLEHAHHQIGEVRLVPSTGRRNPRLQVVADEQWEHDLSSALANITTAARETGLTIATEQGRELLGPHTDAPATHRFLEHGKIREILRLDDLAAALPDRSPVPKPSPELPPTSGARRVTPIKTSSCPRDGEAPGM